MSFDVLLHHFLLFYLSCLRINTTIQLCIPGLSQVSARCCYGTGLKRVKRVAVKKKPYRLEAGFVPCLDVILLGTQH